MPSQCLVSKRIPTTPLDCLQYAFLRMPLAFLAECRRREIPVAVVNGRLSERSFSRYRRLGPVTRWLFGSLAAVAAQDETYADRFRAVGVEPSRVSVTGSMKWDTARIADEVPGADELATAMEEAQSKACRTLRV